MTPQATSGKPLTALVPEFDDYLRPDEARQWFARVPKAHVIGVDGAKHLWVGEPYVRIVLNEIVRAISPATPPLPTEWEERAMASAESELFGLAGKKALVTGASRGIGRVIAAAFATAGADVAVTARSKEGLAETARIVRERGREAIVIPADVTQEETAATVVKEAIKRLGRLDIVVNNAGGSNFVVPFLDMRLSGWTKIMRLNLDATMYVCQAAGAHLAERRTGSVINVASVAGLGASPFLAPYGAAKAGVISLTKSLASEWGRTGIRVNALCPGWTATELNRNLWDTEDGGQATIANVPLGRWGKAAEMAGPAVFLASDASSYMTGQVLIVDGGLSAIG